MHTRGAYTCIRGAGQRVIGAEALGMIELKPPPSRSLTPFSVRSSREALGKSPTLWTATRRANLLFHTYDFDVSGWVECAMWGGDRTLFFIYRISALTIIAVLNILLLSSSSKGIAADGRSFGAIFVFAQHCTMWISSTSTIGVLALFAAFSFVRAFRHCTYLQVVKSTTNVFWWSLLMAHWLYLAALSYALVHLFFNILSHAASGTVASFPPLAVLNPVALLADLLLSRHHRSYATDLLPLLLVFTATPFSIICAMAIVGDFVGSNVHGLGMYWAVVVLGVAVAFAVSYLIGRSKDRVQQ